jgi:hypothetical protein
MRRTSSETIVFIDGVQRIDIRVIGDDSGRIVYGAFSSLAVGAVLVTGRHAGCRRDAGARPGAD